MKTPIRLLAAGVMFTAALLTGIALAHAVPAAPAAAERPQARFNNAAEAYAKKDYALAAGEIRKATGYLREVARRTTGEARAAVDDSVLDLDRLSAAVEQGTVKDASELQRSFAKADQALALAHRRDAAEFWTHRQFDRAGGELKAAAGDLETAAGWTGSEAKAGFAGVVSDTRLLGNKLVTGASWTRDEVSHGFIALGNALDELGQKLGVKDKAAPVSP